MYSFPTPSGWPFAPTASSGEADVNHGVTCIERMLFDDKGRIQPVKFTNSGAQIKLYAYIKKERKSFLRKPFRGSSIRRRTSH